MIVEVRHSPKAKLPINASVSIAGFHLSHLLRLNVAAFKAMDKIFYFGVKWVHSDLKQNLKDLKKMLF